MKLYQDLKIWMKARALVKQVYLASQNFPDDERFGLTSQIRRAIVSVPSNIAEGYGRNSSNDFRRFLRISLGSLYEVQTQLTLAHDLEFISEDAYSSLANEIIELIKMLTVFINRMS